MHPLLARHMVIHGGANTKKIERELTPLCDEDTYSVQSEERVEEEREEKIEKVMKIEKSKGECANE